MLAISAGELVGGYLTASRAHYANALGWQIIEE